MADQNASKKEAVLLASPWCMMEVPPLVNCLKKKQGEASNVQSNIINFVSCTNLLLMSTAENITNLR